MQTIPTQIKQVSLLIASGGLVFFGVSSRVLAATATSSHVAAAIVGKRPDDDLITRVRLAAEASLVSSTASESAQGATPSSTPSAASKVEEQVQKLIQLAAAEKDSGRRSLLHMAAGMIAFRASLDRLATSELQAALNDGTRLSDYAHYYLGLLATRSGESKTALAELQKAIELRPPRPTELDARLELARQLMTPAADGKVTAASAKAAIRELEILAKNLRSDPRYPDVVYSLLHLKRSLGVSPEACRWARELYSKYPTYTKISEGKQLWGPDLRADLLDGKRLGCKATSKDLKTRVRRLWIGGDNQRAEAELRLLDGLAEPDATSDAKTDVKSDVNSPAAANAAEDDSEHNLEEAGDEKVGTIDGLLVNHLIADGRVDEALKMVLQHYQIEKNRVGYLMLLAKAAASAGENQLTIATYSRASELAPGSKTGRNALFQAAFSSYQIQDYDGASRRFAQFLRLGTNSALARDAQWYMAWIRYLRGDFQGAYESFSALAKSPTIRITRRRRRRHAGPVITAESETIAKDRLQYWSAMSLLKLGRSTEAIAVLQNLARDPSVGYYALLALERLKSTSGAQIPEGVEVRLGLKRSGGAGNPSESELDSAILDAIEEARAEYENENEKNDEPDVASEASGADASATEAVAAEDLAPAPIDSAAEVSFKNHALATRFERARDLHVIGLTEAARRELLEIERHASTTADRRLLMSEFANVQNFERSSYIAETSFGGERLRGGVRGESKTYWEHAYPRAWDPSVVQAAKLTGVPEELIWGIMRAESHYRTEAQSPVGALGLMQLMPFTARRVADLMGLSGFDPKTLVDPEVNVRLGSRYLQRLSEKFSAKLPLIAASYNAGPHRVDSWLRNFGRIDMDEFIEHIPYVETRNYVKRVVRNAMTYAVIYRGHLKAMHAMVEPVGLNLEGVPPMKEIW